MKQGKVDSFMESLTNALVGMGVSCAANLVVLPLVLNITITPSENMTLACFFTAISIARSYTLRRVFNGKSVWQSIKCAAIAGVGTKITNPPFLCWKCLGEGRYKIGPAAHDWRQCGECSIASKTFREQITRSEFSDFDFLPQDQSIASKTFREKITRHAQGDYPMLDANNIPLTDEEVAAIHLGRVRLANNSAVKQVTRADGVKTYIPIQVEDDNARMTCNAINILDELLEPYGYTFGVKSLELLGV